jgi:hypothetical protein
MTPGSGNLIMGVAIGYDARQLAPFVNSLKTTDYRGDLVLIVSRANIDAASAGILESQGVILEAFETWRMMSVCIHFARYLKYLEYLIENPYGRIFLTDTRDVIFQADPFAATPDENLFVFAEDQSVAIGNCAANSLWVRESFGTHKLSEIRDQRISCSGTTMGSYSGIMRYLSTMIEAATRANPESLGIDGIDQGIHNVIIHDGALKDFRLIENQRLVATLGHTKADRLSLSAEGKVINADGTMSAVIHQYDYQGHEAIKAAIMARHA